MQETLSQLETLKSVAQGNPRPLFEQMMRSNPSFAQFVTDNAGKTPEQAFRDNGLDYEQFKGYL
jgi:hypothetical protein